MFASRPLRHALFGSSSIVAIIGIASSAHAQDVLETVIVTAEKQATDIQKTGVSITAITPDNVDQSGQGRLQDMVTNVAGVTIYAQSTTSALIVRGVGTTQGVSSTLEMLDGVDTNTLAAENFAAADAARIEVLRGPQGTLYGRGAFSGLVNIVTNDPTDKYEGKVFVEAGSNNLVDTRDVVNIPLDDDMALRIVTVDRQNTGYVHPVGGLNEDYQAVRAKLQYKPTEDFRLLLKGDFLTAENNGDYDTLPTRTKLVNFASPGFGGFNPCGGNPVLNPYDPWHSPPNYYQAVPCTVPAQLPVNPAPVTGVCQLVSRAENTNTDFGFETDYNLGFAALTVIGNDNIQQSPTGALGINRFLGNFLGQNLFSNVTEQIGEVRLNSPDGDNFKWVGGLYWDQTSTKSNNIQRNQAPTTTTPDGTDSEQHQISTDKAAYGQVTVPLIDNRFRIIGGLRYAMDDINQDAFTQNLKTHVDGAPARGDFPAHKLTYKGGIEYDVTPNSMFYAQTSTGFRPTIPTANKFCIGNTSHHTYLPSDGSGVVLNFPSGGCATTAPATATTVGGDAGETSTLTTVNVTVPNDSVTSYEAGLKNRFFDNKVQLNIDGYYYKFQSLFISALGANEVNQVQAIYQSQTGAKAWGSELEITALVTSNDRLDFNLSWEPTTSGISPFANPECFNYGTPTHPLINVIGPTQTTNFAACSAKNLAANPNTVNWVRYSPGAKPGDALFDAPKWNGNISYRHIFDLASGATVSFNVTEHFEASKITNANYFYDSLSPAYHMTNLAIAYDTADGKWELGAWVRNLENYAEVLNAQSASSTSAITPVLNTLASPRTWGVNLSAKF